MFGCFVSVDEPDDLSDERIRNVLTVSKVSTSTRDMYQYQRYVPVSAYLMPVIATAAACEF